MKTVYIVCIVCMVFLGIFAGIEIQKNKDKKRVEQKEIAGSSPDCDTNFCYYPYGIKEEMWRMLIDTIKKYEGLRTQSYYHKGTRLIGYGHSCIGNEPDSMCKFEAEGWLLNDLEIAIKEGYRLTGLKGGKLLCVADFIYTMGSSRFQNSLLYVAIKDNDYECCELIIPMYDNYGNKRMGQRRMFDLWLWKQK